MKKSGKRKKRKRRRVGWDVGGEGVLME